MHFSPMTTGGKSKSDVKLMPSVSGDENEICVVSLLDPPNLVCRFFFFSNIVGEEVWILPELPFLESANKG